MSSALFVALLAASPLVSASNRLLHRQASATSSGDDLNPSQCFYPSTLQTPTGYPTPPPELESFLDSATDGCALSTQPASITSEYSSFASAYNSWVDANSASLISLASFISSYEASISTQSQCTSYYVGLDAGSYSAMASDFYLDIGTCSTASSTGASGSMMTSSATSSAGATASTTSAASTSAASSTSAAAASNTNAASASFRADGVVSSYCLIAGATVAISAFVGMIAL